MASDDGRRNPVVLHVEDDDATAYVLRLELRQLNVNVDVFRTCDGEDAIAFLTREGVFTEAPEPDVVVLDLHLPKKSGHDVLAEIRRQSALRDVPVIMLTSSRADGEREKALALGANEFIIKPKDLDEFSKVAELIVRYISEPLA